MKRKFNLKIVKVETECAKSEPTVASTVRCVIRSMILLPTNIFPMLWFVYCVVISVLHCRLAYRVESLFNYKQHFNDIFLEIRQNASRHNSPKDLQSKLKTFATQFSCRQKTNKNCNRLSCTCERLSAMLLSECRSSELIANCV